MKLLQTLAVALNPFKFSTPFIEKQRFNQLENIFFTGVMRTQISPQRRIHHRLKQAAENCRGNPAPVQCATVQQKLAHPGVKSGVRQKFSEQTAIDIGKRGNLLIQFFQALFRRNIQHLKQAA